MNSKTILLSCALLALLIVQLPNTEAVTCAEDPNNADCVDCTNPDNAANAECTTTITTTTTTTTSTTSTTTTTTTEVPTSSTSTTTTARPTRRHRPRTIFGMILQKKINFLNGLRSKPRLFG